MENTTTHIKSNSETIPEEINNLASNQENQNEDDKALIVEQNSQAYVQETTHCSPEELQGAESEGEDRNDSSNSIITEQAECALEGSSAARSERRDEVELGVELEDQVDFVASSQHPVEADEVFQLTPTSAIKDITKQPSKRLSSVMDIDHLARCQNTTEDVPEVKSFCIALLELAFEKQADIAQLAVETLQKMGRKHPSTVLRTLLNYLSSDQRPSTRVRSTILTVMETTINPAIEAGQLDLKLAEGLMKLAIDEMVSYAEAIPDVQLPSSNILVSIGAVYCKDIVQLLCGRLVTNSLPNPCILLSLASLAMLNIYGTVPHLKGVMEVVVQIVSSTHVKSKSLRRSFATILARFSEAILFYLANMERAPDENIQREWFSEDVAEGFEVLFTQWLPCKDPATCQEILEALGHMSQLLTHERLDHVAPRLLPILIQGYKGPVEPLYVSRCFALFLDAFFNAGLVLSDVNVQEMLNALFQQVTVHPDYAQPSTVKNHYELLRCLERMARVHLDRVVAFLLLKVEQTNEKVRVAALAVLKHLINSLKELLEPHVAAIGAHLKALTMNDSNSHSNIVKKALIQVIVAMAVQGHLLASDTIHSGRHIHLIAYLLKQCTLVPGSESAVTPTGFEVFLQPLRRESSEKGSNGSDGTSPVTNDELRQMCENVIQLLVTTQEPMEGLFWPLLLRHALDPEYSRAMGTIAKALAYLVSKKNLDPATLTAADGPSSTSIVARFLMLARSPVPSEKCYAVLSFLEQFSALIHPSLFELWQAELPPLMKQLKTNVMEQSANQDGWLISMEKLACATLTRMKLASPEWAQLLSAAFFDQISLYEHQPLERGFLFDWIGMCVNFGFVAKGPSYAVDFIMTNVRHQFTEESLGCAAAIAWCSRTHLDVTLLRLQNLERNDYGRRSSGFLGFIKENRSESESDLVKATAARCYRRIATETPATELLLKVDKHIIRAVIHILQSTKDQLVRQEGLEAVGAIAKALWPDRLQERYLLAGRGDLLKETLAQLRSTPLPDHLALAGSAIEFQRWVDSARFSVRALDALAALVRLPPTLRADDQSTLLEAGLERGIPLYAKLCRFAMEECWMVDASLAANQLLMALENLTLQLLRSMLDPSAVDILFSQLMPWSKAQEGSMRRAGLSLLRLTLATFVKEVEFEPGAPTRFSQGHNMIAKIVPRCTDPDVSVRDLAVDCLGLVLDIISKYMGYSHDYEKQTIQRLESLKVDLGSADPICSITELANILNTKTPPSDLWVLLESMGNGLSDPFPSSSSGLSLTMCLILKARGGEIHQRVKDLLDLLLIRLKNIDTPSTRESILNGVCLLASHQRDTVVTSLLSHSLPHNEDISDCWKALAADPAQNAAVLDHILGILTHAAPYEERVTGPHANESIVSWRLLSAVSALKSMCQIQKLSEALQDRFPQLFCVLILAQSCLLGASPPIHFPANGHGSDQPSFVPVNREAYRLNPYQMSVDVLKLFFTCAQLAPLAEPLAEHRHATNSGDLATFCDLVANMTALCTVYKPIYLPNCIHILSTALKSNHLRHRLAAVAFYAELIHQRSSGADLDQVIRGLTSNLTDSSSLIRRVALNGLGGLGDTDPRLWSEFAPIVLDALVDGLEELDGGRDQLDGNSSTAQEALEGLSRLIVVSPLIEVERLASRLALRVRPFFEHELPLVRVAAVSLLAQLFKAGYGTAAQAHLAEQVHATLTSLLIHLNESDAGTVQACKLALRQAGPFLNNHHQGHATEEDKHSSSSINALFQSNLQDGGQLDYLAFLTDLVKLMAADYEEWIHSTYLPAGASYFKSSVPGLRANASLYVGLMCGVSRSNTSHSQNRNISLSLTRLLHDPVKMVRLQAINSISLMYG